MFERYGNMNFANLNGGNAGDYEKLPDGNYVGRLSYLALGETQNGYPKISATFDIVFPQEYEGRKHYVNYVVLRDGSERDRGLVAQAMNFLTRLNHDRPVQLTTLADLAANVQAIAGQIPTGGIIGNSNGYSFTLKTTKKGFQQTIITDICVEAATGLLYSASGS